jgi:hypothetical protein
VSVAPTPCATSPSSPTRKSGRWGDQSAAQASPQHFNPPFVAAAFAPVSAMPIEGGRAHRRRLRLALAAFLLRRMLGLKNAHKLLFWLWFLSCAVTWSVLHGQLSLLLLMGWLLFVVLQMKGREKASGAALASCR